jgi:hypothetical protein
MASGKASSSGARTLKSLLEYLLPGSTSGAGHLRWPPDVFGVCAYVLKLSGSYVEVLRAWPPQGKLRRQPPGANWANWVREVGQRWREVSTYPNRPLPPEVSDLWKRVMKEGATQVGLLATKRELATCLLQLVAMADEASAGAGIPQSGPKDRFWQQASELLAGVDTGQSTLGLALSATQMRVLPKQHSPRGGLTLRSLTHHLALHLGSEVTPFWYTIPQSSTTSHNVNLLVAPWPLKLRPSQFGPAGGALENMPKGYGFVEFKTDDDPAAVATWVSQLIDAAVLTVGAVDGVVFPEASLSLKEYEQVKKVVLSRGAFLIAGVLREAKNANEPCSNLLMFDASRGGAPMNIEQSKHHRWRLDRPQIEMYGLGGKLDPTMEWWEHIALGPREVHFVSLNEQLSLCCLICEDLARQDPVADLVRSVGPNLVVALLMDAPQLGVRWPARYATVLADDPGSSVLTVTSAGMVDLTRPPRSAKPSRSVGLWKDARSDFVELELPRGADGLVLSLCTEMVEEWTADGRSDRGVTGYPRLGGVHAVSVSPAVKRSSAGKDRKRRLRKPLRI